MSTSTNHATHTTELLLPIGSWVVDPAESELGFAVKEMWGLRTVRGAFDEFEGSLTVQGETVSGELKINADSLRTGHPRRDRHLHSPTFFNVEDHPRILFTATGVSSADGQAVIAGELAIGASRLEIQIPVTVEHREDGTLRLEGDVAVSREAAGLGWNALGMIRGEALLRARVVLRQTGVEAGR
jgi:polyisoprenoid-binding protein YceI